MTDLEAVWAAVHENMPAGWYVERPGIEERYGQWSMYAFDPSETPEVHAYPLRRSLPVRLA